MTAETRKIVLFSGGYDSTLLLARLVCEARAGETICAVSVEHNLTGMQKLRREYESQLLILRELRLQFPKIKIEHEVIKVESNWVSGDTGNSRGLAQPILWLCNTIPLLEDGDTIYFGYLQSDQAMLHELHINNLLEAACSIQEGKKINTHYPLKYFTKTDVLNTLINEFPYLVDFCTSCEGVRYEGEAVCGTCVPCTHLKEALLNISITNHTNAEKAKQMLKKLFNLKVTVEHADEEMTQEEAYVYEENCVKESFENENI